MIFQVVFLERENRYHPWILGFNNLLISLFSVSWWLRSNSRKSAIDRQPAISDADLAHQQGRCVLQFLNNRVTDLRIIQWCDRQQRVSEAEVRIE